MHHRSRAFRLAVAIAILSSCIGCDRATKTLATRSLRDSPPQSYLEGTIRLEYALNPGGFLSLGSNLPNQCRAWIFIGANSCLMLAVGAFLVLRQNVPFRVFVALVCVVAGGIGNLIDRIFNHGLVIDFINVGIGPCRTGIFNVADLAVTFGGLAAVLLMQRQANAQ